MQTPSQHSQHMVINMKLNMVVKIVIFRALWDRRHFPVTVPERNGNSVIYLLYRPEYYI